MRVAVVSSQVPFVYGGAELLADALAVNLRLRGFATEVIRIPFRGESGDTLLDHMLAVRLLRLVHADRVIALKFPAYYVEHPDKVVWLAHQFREVYDLWETVYHAFPGSPAASGFRDVVIRTDNALLPEARRLYAISRTVSERLRRFNAMAATVLYPPLERPDRFRAGEFGDYFFFPSRLSRTKRQRLVVESMRYVRTGARLVVAGKPDTPTDLADLEATVDRYDLGDRVVLLGRWISEAEKTELLANARACIFAPYDEDYGYVTLESFQARKPLITCQDSGGPLEFVEHGTSGLVVPPDPVDLAGAIDQLMADPGRARAMGTAGHDRLRSMDLSWDRVVGVLTA